MTSPTPPPGRRYRVGDPADPRTNDTGLAARDGGRWYGMGRHVNHDPQSRRYRFTGPRRQDVSVRHARRIPVFDQYDLGACTGMTGVGVLGTEPYFSAYTAWRGDHTAGIPPYELSPSGAVKLYSDATRADPFDGEYPPDDTGSDGLSIAKVLTAAGAVPGYRHTFSSDQALQALAHFPLMVGTLWYDSMFYPNRHGVAPVSGAPVGGHEYIADEFVPAGQRLATGLTATTDLVGFTTSWGTSFGVDGRFYLTAANFARLLDQDGDVIVLELPGREPPTPTDPAPAPSAVDDADRALMAAYEAWRATKGLD